MLPGTISTQGEVMADLSVFNLSNNRPSIAEAFEEGRKGRQERHLNRQRIGANEQTRQVNDQRIEENEIALKTAKQNQLGNKDDARLNAIVNSALIIQSTPQSSRPGVISNRIQRLSQEGIPTSDLEELQEMYTRGEVEEADALLEQAASLKNRLSGGRRVQSSSFVQLENEDGNTVPAQTVTYSNGDSETIPLQAPEGFSMAQEETAAQKRAAEYSDYVSRQQEETRQAADRAFNNAISAGEATDMAGTKRGIIGASNNKRKAEQLNMLLDQFETGGFSQGLQNTIQSFFGTRPETEEEAENLMKAQAMVLMSNFTGAISDGERAFVVEMAPNFGLSTAGNRRLLNNMIEDAEFQIRAGDAAMKGRDAYDSYVRSVVADSGVSVTAADIVRDYGEDKIAMVMRTQDMTRQEVIDAAIKDAEAERAK